ncbi:methanogenesis marker 9 domain-containing protein [Methermicoccus shengliensis]|uniref:Methanogenesis marker 9 domain-containing protein n=1 Tax=Methermicoccus shengliensis TaxID=660064 RepID=A0A832RWX4_9EURY|nr:methanogenesis marker 9 domain-containing protein [Methermicoccus shengliensis]KUK04841.1 MAG: Methanogenesis marker protein 9 [Euryarchaeota archaeon 55_53]KUK30469.1 MAG: Methanogenesis marker protein 9 [Methanosarcinales archeaon 56_1174]MDI3487881.1 hypothetical protein [Methanosarcinales archaeon]MDN5295377.1 hypothetical protein [Methanosarcinales archaeon]HIH69537.1 methanogenesis marker 9 domain-containing protein [Methermicoccus shengliensis]
MIAQGYLTISCPVATSAMSGITDASFVKRFEDAGLVTIGGYSIDEPTIEASRRMSERGRREFLIDEPFEHIEQELEQLSGRTVAVNVRASSLTPLMELAPIIAEHRGVLEIDAHCRQPEMMEVGAGQALLHQPHRLVEWVRRLKETGVVLSLKMRTNITNEVALARALEGAGLDMLHLDCMGAQRRGEYAPTDHRPLRAVRNATSLLIIGNNGVRDYESAKKMFSKGADMVSVARPLVENPEVVGALSRTLKKMEAAYGWYNMPSHICAGGDLRGLAFCCAPVKNCPLQSVLKQIGLSPAEFMRLKESLVAGTPLEQGEGTCFGSLAYCCKPTRACPYRDAALARAGISLKQYAQYKRKLAQDIVHVLKRRSARQRVSKHR